MTGRARLTFRGAKLGFWHLANGLGWKTTLRRGMPTYFADSCEGELTAVWTKGSVRNRSRLKMLSRAQADMADLLSKHGITCLVSDGATLAPYGRVVHRPKADPPRRDYPPRADVAGLFGVSAGGESGHRTFD